ncbi:MAG: chemotaxis protein CheX [Lachnospiraceae bacterium]|nr:chemotaxis protein CheX [Lachnospiraceae bacterium]
MFDRMFANYLAQCGKLSDRDLEDIFAAQDSKRVRLGVIAVSEKLMTIEQVEEVNQLQAILDKRFGDITVEKGYLNEEQVSRLLVLQGNAYLAFVQAVVDGGYLSMEEVEDMLVRYQKDNNLTLSNIEDLKSCDISRIINIFLYTQNDMAKEMAGVFIRTIVRLVDFHSYIKKPSVLKEYPFKVLCTQGIKGDHKILTALSGDLNPDLKTIASSFAGETNVTCDEDVLDALCELINCVNGLYATDVSNREIDIDMEAPLGQNEAGILKASTILCVPMVVCNKSIDFLLVIDQDYTY